MATRPAAAKAKPKSSPPPSETTPDEAEPAAAEPEVFEPLPEDATIHARMARILAELPAVPKGQQNTQQNYSFRGIDDVLNALNPIMSKYGVFVVPHEITDLEEPHRQSGQNKAVYVSKIKVQYRFYGPTGDFVEAVGIGEGTDSLDKASPKSMTGAYKYMLFEVFSISTKEASDLDADRGGNSPAAEGGELQVHTCPVCAESGDASFQHRKVEVVRKHLVNSHGWHWADESNLDAGVLPPKGEGDDTGAETPPTDEGAKTPPEAPKAATDDETPESVPVTTPATEQPTVAEPAAPEPDAAPDDEPPADDGATDEPAATDDLAWVDELKGQALSATAESLGVSKGGTVAAVKARIKEAYAAALEEEEGGDGNAEDVPATDDAPDAAKDKTTDSGGGFQCPDCDLFPFRTQEEYEAHWFETHGDGADDGSAEDPEATDTATPDEPAATDATEDDYPTLIEAVKSALGGLSGDAARAYGKYRRDNKLGRPDELTAEQATALLEFLGATA